MDRMVSSPLFQFQFSVTRYLSLHAISAGLCKCPNGPFGYRVNILIAG